MERKRNFIFKIFDYVQCIIDKITLDKSLIHSLKIKKSYINLIDIKSSQCKNVKITESDFSLSRWKRVNLSHTEMKECEIEGLKINGYLISELIQHFNSKDDSFQSQT